MDVEMYNATYDTDDYEDVVQSVPVVSIVVNSVVLCLGLCLNIWMIWSLSKSWSKGSRFHFYFLALCVADILELSTILGSEIGVSATGSWEAGNYGCKLVNALKYFTGVFVALLLAGFNIDNFIAVIRRGSVKILRVIFLLAAIFLGILASIPTIWLFRVVIYDYMPTSTYCVYVGHLSLWILNIPNYWIPMAIIQAFGLVTLIAGCLRKGQVTSDVRKREEGIDDDMTTHRKTTGLIIAYDIAFFLCLLPSAIMSIITTYISIGFDNAETLMYVSRLFSYGIVGKILLDPIIYAIHRCLAARRVQASAGL